MSGINGISKAITIAANTIYSKLASAISPKNVDCVFILGPGIPHGLEFLHMAEAQGLTVAFIGDGVEPLTEEMIKEARRKGVIGPDTEVFTVIHGADPKYHPEKKHTLAFELDQKDIRGVETIGLIKLLREPLTDDKNSISNKKSPWGGEYSYVELPCWKLKS